MIKFIFFDKNTGEKSAKLSRVLLSGIHHYHLKSETTGKTVLLSAFGIQRRFSETPNQRVKSIRNLFPRFLNLRELPQCKNTGKKARFTFE